MANRSSFDVSRYTGLVAGVATIAAVGAGLVLFNQTNKEFRSKSKLKRRLTLSETRKVSNGDIRGKTGANSDANGASENVAPTPQTQVYRHTTVADELTGSIETTCMVMVGMPGRGKTAIANRTAQYLRFFHGLDCEVFNPGAQRGAWAETVYGKGHKWASTKGDSNHTDLFDDSDGELVALRRRMFLDTLDNVKQFLAVGQARARVAIFDAANATRERRAEVYTQLKKLGKVAVIFVEVTALDTMVENSKVEFSGEDGGPGGRPENVAEYMKNVERFAATYEPIACAKERGLVGENEEDIEEDYSYIKCIEHGSQLVYNNIRGYMPGRIAQFLSSTSRNTWQRCRGKRLFFSRHGQSENNKLGRIGGDTGLTEAGERYALALAAHAEKHLCVDPSAARTSDEFPCRLWTSSLQRTQLTARHIPQTLIMQDGYPFKQMNPRVWKNLDEIYAGACDGMTYEEIEEQYSAEAKARAADKLTYRYPRGESYLDVIERLEPLVHEIERHTESLLIVGHQGVLRMLLAFYSGVPRSEAPFLELKLNHVTTLKPHAFGCEAEVVNLLEAVTLGDDGQKQM
mmetsp:Transcript_81677/g.159455  ORF Transcript_81677/g.159455 Transcript_81677/m.159455 type:complete len:574 (+) Transcript_81677:57-1778(+)